MAITGIDTIDGKQIIAAGASSAVKAAQDSNGNNIASTYQTTAGMSNYQTTADMGDYATTGQVAEKLDISAFSDVSGDFLTAVPGTYLQNTDLNTTDGKISAISGIPLEDTSNVFVAEYGITTYNEIASAYSAGKALMCKYNNLLLNLCYKASGEFIFAGFAGHGIFAYAQDQYVVRCTTNSWFNFSYGLQADWNINDNYAPGYIWNKPSIPTVQLNGDNEVSSINNYPLAGGGSFPASADEACQVVTANSADWNEVSAKLDESAVWDLPYVKYNSADKEIEAPSALTLYRDGWNYLKIYGVLSADADPEHPENGNIYAPNLSSDQLKFGTKFLTANAYGISGAGYYIDSDGPNGGETNPVLHLIGAATSVANGIHISTWSAGAIDSYGRKTWSIKNLLGDTNPSFSMAGAVTANGNGVFIDVNGASGVDNYGNVKWQVGGPARQLYNGATDSRPAILIVSPPATTQYSAQWSASPYISAGDPSQGITVSYGSTASSPYANMKGDSVQINYNSAHASFGYQDATVSLYTAWKDPDKKVWSLTGSVQKREIEGDSATSAITAIAGSAISADIDLTPYQTTAGMTDYLTTATFSATSALLNDDIQTVSAAIPVLSSLNTEGITDIQLVNALPADPVSTVLYLIPEA